MRRRKESPLPRFSGEKIRCASPRAALLPSPSLLPQPCLPKRCQSAKIRRRLNVSHHTAISGTGSCRRGPGRCLSPWHTAPSPCAKSAQDELF